jgi:hypothetical protein
MEDDEGGISAEDAIKNKKKELHEKRKKKKTDNHAEKNRHMK